MRRRRAPLEAPAPVGPDLSSWFNLDYFAGEIQPVLFGTVDYNDARGTARRERQLRTLVVPWLAE